MPYKERPVEKLYHTIGEVADHFGVNTSLLRYWEKEFRELRPKRTNKGDRLYTKADIERIAKIHHLVKEKGFTIQGAKEALRTKEAVQAGADELKDRLLG
ncbi:MAG: MerR family transcriptional regulator, partial [Flavobacteriales bacterium]|nr:MerR family transcriptional regulator [Flavobacteriales bacterium]